jgi:hypothetical protein
VIGFKDLFENDQLSLVKMMTQGLRYLTLDPEPVEVEFRKTKSSRKKDCYNNTFRAMGGTGAYVLGFVFFHGIPIEHAWLKEGGKYFDPTLDPKDQQGYVKVLEVPHDQLMAYVEKNGHSPSLYDLNRFVSTMTKM